MISRAALFLVCCLALTVRADPATVTPVPGDPAALLKLPQGFKADVFANVMPAGGSYFQGPRFMAFGLDGNPYLSLGLHNMVVMLPDRDRDGKADSIVTIVEKLNGPQGLAFVDNVLYVANQDGIVRLERRDGQWPDGAVYISDDRAGMIYRITYRRPVS